MLCMFARRGRGLSQLAADRSVSSPSGPGRVPEPREMILRHKGERCLNSNRIPIGSGGHARAGAVIDPSRGLNTTIRPLQPLSPFTSRGDKPGLARNILLRVGGELLPMSSQAAARSPWRSGSGQFKLLGSDPAPRRADCDATPAVCRRASRRGREADHSIARGVDSICRASETQREVWDRWAPARIENRS